MPPKKTRAELLEWYGRFAKEMREKMEIDVTRKEDIGRIKSYQIVEWDPDEPMLPEVKPMFAYMPHRGTEYKVPEPPIPGPDDPSYDGIHVNMAYYKDHAKWMMDNLNPDLTDAQLQDLYDHSCNGTLIATKPGKSFLHIQQVLTDADGNIKISVPAGNYLNQDIGPEDQQVPEDQRVPEDQHAPNAPTVVPEPNPADFGRPEEPARPTNWNPGWLSRLGHLLGFYTDYSKLLDFNSYTSRLQQWRNDPNGKQAYDTALTARTEYLKNFAELQNHPYYKFCALDSGIRNRIRLYDNNEQIVAHYEAERSHMETLHKNSPLFKVPGELESINKQLAYAGNTELAIHNITGHDPHPEQMSYWIQTKVINPETFKPEKYDLPPIPNSNGTTGDQLNLLEKEWKDLADVAGFAAISDYDLAGNLLRPSFNLEDSADLNYSMLLANLFTEGRPNSWREIPYAEPARKLAKNAMDAYSNGMPQQLGGLFARSLRQTMREAAGLHNMVGNGTMGALHLIGRLVEKLDKHPLVLAASGLKPEEIEEARGYAELLNVLTAGAKGRKVLLEHATGQNPSSPEELEQAGKDALFANIVIREVAIAYKEQSRAMESRADYQEYLIGMAETAAFSSVRDEAAKAEKNSKPEEAKQLKERADQMEHRQMVCRSKTLLLEFTRPGYHHITKNLLNKNWVNAVKNQLAEKVGLSKILSGNHNAILEPFLNNVELDKFTKNLGLEPKPEQTAKNIQLEAPNINAQQSNRIMA